MRYDLVPMDRSHLEGVLAIERACFRQPWSEQVFVDALYNDTVSLIVAQAEDGRVLGYAALSVSLEEGSLDKIAVDPACRRQGVGEELLKVFLRFGRANLAFLTLEVRASNDAAIGLYEKLGFQTVGRRKNYYAQEHEDALLMTAEFPRIGVN
mgnify:CR=1 FL=1